ncbi:MAG: hypothetical protein IT379_29535 [Deltaproteobacteria bacterium]|nr:hypothetical protein [Deltaproteobacteria bacterium]
MRESAATDLVVVAERDGRRLLSGPPSAVAAQSDERPTFEMRVQDGGRTIPAPGRVLGGALVEGGVVWVTPAFELIDGRSRVLDRDVIPEIAVTACGGRIAYPHRAGEGQGVYVLALPDGEPRRVTDDLATADRPLFLLDGSLLVVGSRPSGIAGLWRVDPEGAGQATPLTNADLRTGRPLGPTFVPPPAYHASMRVEGNELVYDDGRRERRVVLP